MVMARMTAVSRENVRGAERIEVFEVRGRWAVKVWIGERLGLVHGGDGLAMLYPSIGAAERAVRRINGTVHVVVGAPA